MKWIALLLLMTPFFANYDHVKEKDSDRGIFDNEENFDKFFKSFCQNARFQLSHIRFPLKVVVVDDEKRREKLIQQSEWRHTNLLKLRKEHARNTLETVDKGTDGMDVVFTNDETGEVVHHLFSKIDKQWFLMSIVDESK